MRTVLLTLGLLLAVLTWGQTSVNVTVKKTEVTYDSTRQATLKYYEELDKELFGLINEYRKSKGRKALEWDQKLYDGSKHHSTYQAFAMTSGHDESIDVKDFTEESFKVRAAKYDIWGECVATTGGSPPNVQKLLELWKKSPLHNNILLDKNFKRGACSVASIMQASNIGDRQKNYCTFDGAQ